MLFVLVWKWQVCNVLWYNTVPPVVQHVVQCLIGDLFGDDFRDPNASVSGLGVMVTV